MSAVEDALTALSDTWRIDAKRRLAMSSHDVAGSILLFCSNEILRVLDTASADDEELSPAEFASLPHVQKSPSTVRRWCQLGRIPCRQVGRDYRIRRGESLPAG